MMGLFLFIPNNTIRLKKSFHNVREMMNEIIIVIILWMN